MATPPSWLWARRRSQGRSRREPRQPREPAPAWRASTASPRPTPAARPWAGAGPPCRCGDPRCGSGAPSCGKRERSKVCGRWIGAASSGPHGVRIGARRALPTPGGESTVPRPRATGGSRLGQDKWILRPSPIVKENRRIRPRFRRMSRNVVAKPHHRWDLDLQSVHWAPPAPPPSTGSDLTSGSRPCLPLSTGRADGELTRCA